LKAKARAQGLPSPLFGLAPGGACRAPNVAARAVRSYRTLSPLPLARRFAFCGAIPGVAPAGPYPAPCLRGARTFLCVSAAAVQPTGLLRDRRPRAGMQDGCGKWLSIQSSVDKLSIRSLQCAAKVAFGGRAWPTLRLPFGTWLRNQSTTDGASQNFNGGSCGNRPKLGTSSTHCGVVIPLEPCSYGTVGVQY